ncbi:hypothetical protein [Paenibacillus sp. NPDC057934]|uniref:hypothetical protein n=1 Tax=Paenibacillus sp. NPDC057934 TaxID=3346282 RepID=UPI0036DAFDBF
MLSTKQLNIRNAIEDAFTSEKTNVVCIHGPTGSGKTTVIKEYLEKVENFYEDWAGYYIEGTKGLVDAYSTITFAEDVKLPFGEHTGTSFSLGLSIPKIFSVGLTNSFRKKELFDSKISFFVKKLNKINQKNIVIVADSYQYWDKSSKSFLETLITSKKVLSNKNIKIVMIIDEDEKQQSPYLEAKTFFNEGKILPLALPEDHEMKEILSVLGYNLSLSKEELETIRSLSGANIDFIKIVVEGLHSHNSSIVPAVSTNLNLMKILEYRLELFGEQKKDFFDILKASSIIEGNFNIKEIEYLCKDMKNIDFYLHKSCEYLLLKKSDEFMFSNNRIQEYFYERLAGSVAKFHFHYSHYLREHKSENYLARAIHLSFADNENKYLVEVIGLLILAYCRNMEVAIHSNESIHIKEMLNKIFESNTSYNIQIQCADFNHLIKSCELYMVQDYLKAYEELNNISSSGSLLFNAEVARVQLLVSLMLDMNTDRISKHTDNLKELMVELKFSEKEQWAQCSFALFSTYSNKLGDFDQTEMIALDLEKFIRNQSQSPFYEYMGKILNRKSFLYKSVLMSRRAIQDSVAYFERTEDYLQYYFALCNYAGILIVTGKYSQAISHLNKCLELIAEHQYIKFPSKDKVYNNLFLADFLSSFRNNEALDEVLLDQTITNFKNKLSLTPNEKNAIMLLNLMNLLLIKGDFKGCYTLLDDLKKHVLVDNEDNFYDYYISNVQLVGSILENNWEDATSYLKRMQENPPTFHKKNKKKFTSRITALEKLVVEKKIMNPIMLDKWIYDNSTHEDDASEFYCRLFLFSDLQFSSL